MSRTFASSCGSVENLNVPEPVRLDPEVLPHPRHGRVRDRLAVAAQPGRQQPGRPVRDPQLGRRLGQRDREDLVPDRPRNGRWLPRPRLVGEPGQAVLGEPGPPPDHRRLRSTRPARRSPDPGNPVRRQQHDPSPLHHPRRRPLRPRLPQQHSPLIISQQQRPHPVGHDTIVPPPTLTGLLRHDTRLQVAFRGGNAAPSGRPARGARGEAEGGEDGDGDGEQGGGDQGDPVDGDAQLAFLQGCRGGSDGGPYALIRYWAKRIATSRVTTTPTKSTSRRRRRGPRAPRPARRRPGRPARRRTRRATAPP